MQLDAPMGTLRFIDETGYSFGSADNVRHYPFSQSSAIGDTASSIHGVLLNEKPLVVFGACGGASCIHSHSALVQRGTVYLAVGNSVFSFQPAPFEFGWALEVDQATCFGVYFHPQKNALISHGELEISRFSGTGEIIWSASGADIFSGGLTLHSDCIEVVDFNKKSYYFSYENGEYQSK
jgi:hypothetical protein